MNTSSAAVERLEVQRGLAHTWSGVDPAAVVEVKRSIEEAIAWCRDVAGAGRGERDEEVMVLVTGSVHLVGGFLEVLETGKG